MLLFSIRILNFVIFDISVLDFHKSLSIFSSINISIYINIWREKMELTQYPKQSFPESEQIWQATSERDKTV